MHHKHEHTANHIPTILVVDDDDSAVRAITTRLTNAGYKCLTAKSGGEGLAACCISDVDLVITDLRMPGVDGLGVVALIRNASDIPIIVVTGCLEEYRRSLKDVCNVVLIAKPFESAELIHHVEIQLASRLGRSLR